MVCGGVLRHCAVYAAQDNNVGWLTHSTGSEFRKSTINIDVCKRASVVLEIFSPKELEPYSCGKHNFLSLLHIKTFSSVVLKVWYPQGSCGGFRGRPAKRWVIYFHYNPIHKRHNDRMYIYFGHGFHILCNKTSKILPYRGPWDKILSNEGPWSV